MKCKYCGELMKKNLLGFHEFCEPFIDKINRERGHDMQRELDMEMDNLFIKYVEDALTDNQK